VVPLGCCSVRAVVVATLTTVAASYGEDGASTLTLDCPIALVRPFLTTASAEFSALLSRPAATD
jgi:hypothetical protein